MKELSTELGLTAVIAGLCFFLGLLVGNTTNSVARESSSLLSACEQSAPHTHVCVLQAVAVDKTIVEGPNAQ